MKEILDYDALTGIFRWKTRPIKFFPSVRSFKMWNKRFAGKQTFVSNGVKGYMFAGIFNETFRAHIVAWCYHYGEWPSDDIDHIDGNPANNAISNLRVVSNKENHRNVKKPTTNTSGVVGVRYKKDRKKWQARLQLDRIDYHLGYFDTKEEAILARKIADIRYGFHKNHGR